MTNKITVRVQNKQEMDSTKTELRRLGWTVTVVVARDQTYLLARSGQNAIFVRFNGTAA